MASLHSTHTTSAGTKSSVKMSEVIPNILSDIRSLFYDTNVKGSTHSHPYVSIFSILFRTEGLIFESWASRTQTIKLSSDQDTQPNCQGLLEAIQMHLCSIKDVVSGPSSSLSPATLKVATSRLRDIRCLNDQLALELSVENCRLCRVEARALRISSMSYPADLDQLENMSSLASALSGDTPLYAPATRASDISDLEPFDDEKQMKKAGRRITRYLVKYRNSDQRSLLEYKYYGEDYVDGEEGSTIFDRVQHLAAMLYTAKPARLRVLQCIGVFEEPQHCRYGLLHRLPTSAHRQLGPVTLLKYLNSKWKPSLTDRMELARKLAFCMLELHLGGWLHKNFRSENILFFPEETSTRRKLDNPYLIGMECARPDRKDEISEPTTAYVHIRLDQSFCDSRM